MKADKYYKNLGRVLISEEDIKSKIRELAEQISKDYQGKDIIFVCNLKGSFRFLSDLISYMTIPVMIEFITFKSYDGIQPGQVQILKDMNTDIDGRNVIIIEDIADTGYTIDFIIKYLKNFKNPCEIKVCVLLNKQDQRKVDIHLDYKGFDIPDLFIVGYGLDYKEYFRELNDLREYHEW